MILLAKSAVVGAIFATGVIIDEKSLIPIGTLIAVCGLVWWMGRTLQRIDDQLEKHGADLKTIGDKLNHLPCETWNNKCEVAVEPEKEKNKPLKML